jgi:AcrR family transcriptional regulator
MTESKRKSERALAKRPPKEKRTLKGLGVDRASAVQAILEGCLPLVENRAGQRMNPQIVDEGIRYVASGGTIAGYAKAAGLSVATVWRHIKADPRYEDAVEQGAEIFSERLMRVAMTPDMQTEVTRTTSEKDGVTVVEKTGDAVFARKLVVWAGMEWLKTRAPRKFGRRTTTEVNVTMASAIASARKRVRNDDVVDVEARDAKRRDGVVQITPAPSVKVELPLPAPAEPDADGQPAPSLFSDSVDGDDDDAWLA